MIPITRPVFLAVNRAFRELPDEAGVDLGIDRECHVEAILLHLVDVPQSVGGRPPDTLLP